MYHRVAEQIGQSDIAGRKWNSPPGSGNAAQIGDQLRQCRVAGIVRDHNVDVPFPDEIRNSFDRGDLKWDDGLMVVP